MSPYTKLAIALLCIFADVQIAIAKRRRGIA